MSTYGDRGNIICLQKRCEWRKIETKVKHLDLGFKIQDLRSCDFLFMGGAQDTQQKIVSHDFSKEKVKALKEIIEDGVTGLYICGAYQFLGKYYKEADGNIIDGLCILDLCTENRGEKVPRLIGNVVIKTDVITNEVKQSQINGIASSSFDKLRTPRNDKKDYLVGFENHGGRTYLGKEIKPLGKVLKGFGNNGEDKTEGVVYKNSFGSYLHGPILPKNPHFADYLIKLALKRKYKKSINLSSLNDSLEWQAHETIAKRLGISV